MIDHARIRLALIAAALAALSGCGALGALGDVSTALDVYELRTPAPDAPAARALQRDVIVELPTSGGTLDTDRILIRPNPLQAQYLPDARWSDPTPLMVQTMMLRALEATGGLRYVGRQPLGGSGDFAVVTELTDFQAELQDDGETAMVRLGLVSRVVREADAGIVAGRTFAVSAPAASVDTQPLIAAFDSAASRLFADHAAWVLGVVGGR